MSRLLVVWLGAFVGAFAVNAASQLLSGIPAGVIPGMLLFAALSAVVPATLMPAGFACGFLLLRRRSGMGMIFVLSLVMAAVAVIAPYLVAEWSPPSRGDVPALAWAPFFGGVILAFAPAAAARSDAIAARAASPFEFARRGLAVSESTLLVFPLIALWPFGLIVFVIENHARIDYLLIGLIVMGIGAAALAALVHLLETFLEARGPALRLVARSWWVCVGGGAALVLLGSVVTILEWSGTISRGLQTPIGFGIFGLPALLPSLHMVLEARATAGARSDRTRGP